MTSYDEWKTRTPEDESPTCDFCGASLGRRSLTARGWQPSECDGQCGLKWRDPDAERESRRDDR